MFIFRGREDAAKTLDAELLEALGKMLAGAGAQVYEKYPHAAVQAESNTAERFLKTKDLSQIASVADPLGLCSGAGSGNPVNLGHAALVDVKDYLDTNGTVDGQKLLEDFGRSPYGWSKDTTRYVVAALLTAGEIKLRVSNQDILTRSDAAIDAMKNVPRFNKAGIALRTDTERPDREALLGAAKRLLEITGQEVLPLEENVSAAVARHFPGLQAQVAPLVEQLRFLSLPGAERAKRLQKTIQDLLSSEASIIKRVGAQDSEAYEDIVWAKELVQAFENNLDEPIRQAQRLKKEILSLPNSGIPGGLRQTAAPLLSELDVTLARDDFHRYAAEMRQKVHEIEKAVEHTVKAMREERQARLQKARESFAVMPQWARIGEEERQRIGAVLEPAPYACAENLDGLREVIAQQYEDAGRLEEASQEIARLVQEVEEPPAGERTCIRIPKLLSTREHVQQAESAIGRAKGYVESGKSVELELE